MVLIPLARGGVHLGVERVALGVALSVVALCAWERSIPRAVVPFLACLAWIFLTTIPLPPTLHRVSPAAVTVFDIALRPLALYPAARPLSRSPERRCWRLPVQSPALPPSCLPGSGASACAPPMSRCGAFAVAGLVVGVATCLCSLVRLTSFFSSTAPFANPNHLAAFLVLTCWCSLALALRATGPFRLVWISAFALSTVLCFATLSRGGLASYVFGGVLFISLWAWRARRAPGRAPPVVAVAGVVGATTLTAGVITAVPILEQSPKPSLALRRCEVRRLAGGTAGTEGLPCHSE